MMEDQQLMIALAALAALLCFGMGYFVGLSPFNYNRRLGKSKDELEGSAPLPVPQAPRVSAPLGKMPLDELLEALARAYQAQEIAVFDNDGLMLQGASVDPALGLRVAGLTAGRNMLAPSSDSNKSVYYQEGELGIHGLACQTQPLWLVLRGASKAVCERDLRQLGLAIERKWAWAA